VDTFRVFAALLNYPTEELAAALPEMEEILAREGLSGPEDRTALAPLFTELANGDIYDLQARYIELFDQSRSLSLHLFEHVHGESRDRGQAMVDLLERYREQGLELAASELPDFLPVYLEYLSQLPIESARSELAQPVAVIHLLGERLAKRRSAYAAALAALEHLAAGAPSPADIEELTLEEAPEDGRAEALDAEWQEEPVDFTKRETTLVGRQHARALGAAHRKTAGGGPEEAPGAGPAAARPTAAASGNAAAQGE